MSVKCERLCLRKRPATKTSAKQTTATVNHMAQLIHRYQQNLERRAFERTVTAQVYDHGA